MILPCSVGRYEKDVFWRDENSKSVYDIITGEVDFHDQDAAYRDRVYSFPSEFAKGNYSIRLRNVKPTDPGPYSCHIPNSITVYVQLKIKGVYGCWVFILYRFLVYLLKVMFSFQNLLDLGFQEHKQICLSCSVLVPYNPKFH